MIYNVDNPHPGFGTDPNIINEFGHTRYPRYVGPVENRVIVQNKEEEEKVLTELGHEEKKSEPFKPAW